MQNEKEDKLYAGMTVIWLILALVMLFWSLTGCKNYEVVQEVQLNLYHLQNPKNKKVQIILTKDKLEVGKLYRLKQINIIKDPYDED